MEKVIYLTNGSAALSESHQQIESLKGTGKSKNLRAHHTAMQPIRSKEDFDKFCTYFLSNHNYRDYALFIVGIELGQNQRCLQWKRVSRYRLRRCGAEDREDQERLHPRWSKDGVEIIPVPPLCAVVARTAVYLPQRKSAFRTAGKRDFEQGSKGNWRHLSGCHAHPAQDMGLPHLHQPQKRQHGPDGHHEKLQPFCPRHHAALYRHGRGAPKRNVHGV